MREHSPLLRQWPLLRLLCVRHFGVTVREMAQEMGVTEKTIRRDLEDAKEQKAQAERKLKEYEDKLAGMEQELEGMRAELKKAADVESEKVVANAERMASSMVETAKLAAEQEVRKAKTALRNEAVELAMELAESLIREKINDTDRKKIVEDYLGKVGGMK